MAKRYHAKPNHKETDLIQIVWVFQKDTFENKYFKDTFIQQKKFSSFAVHKLEHNIDLHNMFNNLGSTGWLEEIIKKIQSVVHDVWFVGSSR